MGSGEGVPAVGVAQAAPTATSIDNSKSDQMRFIHDLQLKTTVAPSTVRRSSHRVGSPGADQGHFRQRQLTMLWLAAIIVVALMLTIPPGSLLAAASSDRLPSTTHYAIQAKLDYARASLTASEIVTYQNNLGQPLRSLVFNVVPAHFGSFQLLEATVDGQPVQPSLNGVVMEVPLPQLLEPGQSVSAKIDFSLAVPTPGNLRFGQGNGILALGNWYPVLAVWAEGSGRTADWRRDRYVDTGDAFFTQVADYDVSLQVDVPVTVAHTGNLVGHEGLHWVFRASRVRDFALAISHRYETASTTVGNTTITAFYLPEHASAGQQYLESAAESLAWFDATLGDYPYATLHVAETNTADPTWVGQEYPNAIFISSQVSAGGGGAGSYLDYLVVHEVLHQWFYGLVGNDQIFEPWVDEATVTYVTYMYFRANYPSVYQGLWGRALENYEQTRLTWGDRAVDSSIYDFDDENHYFGIVYRKGAIFLDELRNLMGDEQFFTFLRQYINNHRYGLATAGDFLAEAQAHAPVSISDLIGRYFRYQIDQTPSPTPLTPTPTAALSPTASSIPSPTSAEPSATETTPPPTATPAPAVATVPPSMPDNRTGVTPTATPAFALEQTATDILAVATVLWPLAVPAMGIVVVGWLIYTRRR